MAPPGFWKTVGLLLKAARVRSVGRRARQRQLLHNKTGKSSVSALGVLATAGAVLIAVLINGMAAGLVYVGITASQRYAAEQQGMVVVSTDLFQTLRSDWPADRMHASRALRTAIDAEAKSDAEHYGGSHKQIEDRLWAEILDHGATHLYSARTAAPGIKALAGFVGLPQMIGSLTLLLWFVMLICQGEGMELDLQRRRHPMWEWLLAHPIQPGAAFLAEMLMPLSANSVYWCGPVFVGALYGMVYGVKDGILAAVLAGLPVTVGAACLGKALEIGVMIRFAPRSRGGILGLLSWLGYAVLLFSFAGFYILPRLIMATGRLLSLPASLPWPWLQLFLGGALGKYNFAAGVLFCWLLGALMMAAGVSFSLWGAQKGLSGNVGLADTRVRYRQGQRTSFGRDPLYRKESLWFLRDRGAIVQAILIPMTAAGYQLFNLRGLLQRAQGEWNYLSGAAICFGTYFLWVLGPKSLTSEGTALWIPLTWPRGLESLLKAKAWLWTMVSTGLVLLVLLYAAILYPGDIWKIALVLLGWFLFARSMAEKAVTLVSVAASSGEAPKIPSGRRWATQMGMLTFAIGVITQQWHLAIVGIVFSYMTAAAMWQNFRARLPFLFDPWSEKLPPPPTVMHAMIAISAMLEVTSLLTAMIAIFSGQSHMGLAMLFGYGISSVVVCLVTMNFLYNRNVPPSRIWNWPAGAVATDELPGEATEARSDNYGGSILFAEHKEKSKFTLKPLVANLRQLVPLLAFGALAGAALGALAHGYTLLLHVLPSAREAMQRSAEQMAQNSDLRLSYAILAICFAPFAEEYLFRGLLFRTLDREWGGWRAVLASALFFTVYHPVLAWIPVFTLGVVNALLFKKSGKLLPAVALHMAYNLVVSAW